MRTISLPTIIAALFARAVTALADPCRAADTADPAQTQRPHALFDETWEAWMQAYPEWATCVGDHRYGDRLMDGSLKAVAERDALERQTLERALAIRRHDLSPTDRASLDVFVYSLRERVREQPFVGYRSMSLGSQDGFQTGFASLLQIGPVEQRAQVEQMLLRMAAYPRRVDQEIAHLREGLALGWVPPRSVQQRVLAQIDAQLAPERDKSPLFRALPAPGLGHPGRRTG
jgi:uncharacterized protein (DUF885 family)